MGFGSSVLGFDEADAAVFDVIPTFVPVARDNEGAGEAFALVRVASPGALRTRGPGVRTLVGLLDCCVSSSRNASASAALPVVAADPDGAPVDAFVGCFVDGEGALEVVGGASSESRNCNTDCLLSFDMVGVENLDADCTGLWRSSCVAIRVALVEDKREVDVKRCTSSLSP